MDDALRLNWRTVLKLGLCLCRSRVSFEIDKDREIAIFAALPSFSGHTYPGSIAPEWFAQNLRQFFLRHASQKYAGASF